MGVGPPPISRLCSSASSVVARASVRTHPVQPLEFFGQGGWSRRPLVVVADAGGVAVETTLDSGHWRIQTHSDVNKQGAWLPIGYRSIQSLDIGQSSFVVGNDTGETE
ncbi:hypothetical protein F5Y03DRAFT_389961 [Xylaria venustula]|nr:hypothetical protein F5Y03DRAFT_389961 [Xylaria venustula]